MRVLATLAILGVSLPALAGPYDCGSGAANECDGGGSTNACQVIGNTFKCDQLAGIASGAATVRLSGTSSYAQLQGTVGSTSFCCTTGMTSLTRFEVWGTSNNDTVQTSALLPGHGLTVDVRGQDGNDRLFGLDTADTNIASELHGGNGNDWIFGNQAGGLVIGDAGDDILIGAWGDADTIQGNTGNDILCEPDGNGDLLLGDSDDDTLYYNPHSSSAPHSSTDGGSGTDTCNNGPGSSWAASCSYTAEVPPACASGEVGTMVLFYQYVDYYTSPYTVNVLRSSRTSDGINLRSDQGTDEFWLAFETMSYADTEMNDPVFSQRADGTWDLMAHDVDGFFRWDEGGTCPYQGNDTGLDLVGVAAATPPDRDASMIGKLSTPAIDVDGTYFLHATEHDEIALFRLDDGTWMAATDDAVEVAPPSISAASDLNTAESVVVIEATDFPTSGGYRLEPLDVTVAQRYDGDWVMYFKGIYEDDAAAYGGTPSEVCYRDIYRAVSSDLISWSITTTPVVSKASVPEAYTDQSGRVWLYYQDFSNVDDCGGALPAERAPITARWEQDDYALSAPQTVIFDEDFQLDTGLHYATNPTPVLLPTNTAIGDFEACL